MAVAAVANQDLYDAADELGTVYRILAGQGDLPLDRWAIPRMTTLHGKTVTTLDGRLLTALAALDDGVRVAESAYLNSYRTVMTKLREAAAAEAALTLDRQVRELTDLDRRLGRGDIPERLHRIADSVGRRVDGFVASAPDLKYARAVHGEPQFGVFDRPYAQLMDESLRTRVKAALPEALSERAPSPPESQREATNLCKVLSLHPEFVRILAEYAISAKDGDRLVHRLVAQAMAATAELDATLRVHPDHVWRYSPLIALGIKRLGLADADGFPEYAVDIGHVIGRSWIQEALGALGLVILLVGILLTGPLAVTGLALDATLTGIALADLATTGAAAQLTYLGEREQDIAAIGGGFSAGRIAQRSDYSGSALAAAATLICGMAFVFSGAKLIKNWRARKPGTPPIPTGPTRNTPAARRRSVPDATGTAGKGLGNRLGTRARPRSTEGERRLGAGPRRAAPRETDADRVRLRAVSGAREGPPPTGPSTGSAAGGPKETSPRATDLSATSTGDGSIGVSGRPATVPTIAAPGASLVADASFTVSSRQRGFPTKALTHETEKAVGAKLELATGVTARSKRAQSAQLLRDQIPKGGKAPPITKPVLLKEPVITDPRYPAPEDRLASAKPDFLLLTPNQNEVFEVTMDSRFSIVPQERGLQLRGSAVASGSPHKQIQVRKTLDYLIRRYPDSAIVYNIQTIGEVPPEVLNILRSEADVARKLLAAEGGKGSVQIVVRADQTFVF